MKLLLIFVAAVVATSCMTLFSYILSNIKSSQFREPELLNSLICRSTSIKLTPSKNSGLGWAIHYLIGFLFIVLFHLIWNLTGLEPNVITGAVLGFVAGIVGITGWIIMFKLNPKEPQIEFKNFYLQLLFAHIIFGASAGLVYQFW